MTEVEQKKEKLRFPPWYRADSPETKERRRKLLQRLNAPHSIESEIALDQLIKEYFDGDEAS